MSTAGFVLVGGKSRRMGRDKALIEWGGKPWAARIATALEQATEFVALLGDPSLYQHLGWPVWPDAIEDCGPIGGLWTALTRSPADWNLLAACDLPDLSVDTCGFLLETARQKGSGCVMPLGANGQPQPLAAVYHRGVLGQVETQIASGNYRMLDLVRNLEATLVTLPIAPHNLNTPEDLRHWRAPDTATKSLHG